MRNLNPETPYRLYINGEVAFQGATEQAGKFYYQKALPVYKHDLIVLKFNDKILIKNK